MYRSREGIEIFVIMQPSAGEIHELVPMQLNIYKLIAESPPVDYAACLQMCSAISKSIATNDDAFGGKSVNKQRFAIEAVVKLMKTSEEDANIKDPQQETSEIHFKEMFRLSADASKHMKKAEDGMAFHKEWWGRIERVDQDVRKDALDESAEKKLAIDHMMLDQEIFYDGCPGDDAREPWDFRIKNFGAWLESAKALVVEEVVGLAHSSDRLQQASEKYFIFSQGTRSGLRRSQPLLDASVF